MVYVETECNLNGNDEYVEMSVEGTHWVDGKVGLVGLSLISLARVYELDVCS